MSAYLLCLQWGTLAEHEEKVNGISKPDGQASEDKRGDTSDVYKSQVEIQAVRQSDQGATQWD
jgi:hypothetical protein